MTEDRERLDNTREITAKLYKRHCLDKKRRGEGEISVEKYVYKVVS